jgi:hypothetical protein
MQAIDQALENRTATLEATSEELTKKSRELSRSTTTLHNHTRKMPRAIEALQITSQVHTTHALIISNLFQPH